jgi:hypothetical protein
MAVFPLGKLVPLLVCPLAVSLALLRVRSGLGLYDEEVQMLKADTNLQCILECRGLKRWAIWARWDRWECLGCLGCLFHREIKRKSICHSK